LKKIGGGEEEFGLVKDHWHWRGGVNRESEKISIRLDLMSGYATGCGNANPDSNAKLI